MYICVHICVSWYYVRSDVHEYIVLLCILFYFIDTSQSSKGGSVDNEKVSLCRACIYTNLCMAFLKNLLIDTMQSFSF